MITNLQAVIPIDLGKIRLQYLVVLMVSFSFALVYLENDNIDTKAVTVHSERMKRGWIKDGEKQVAINVPSRLVWQVKRAHLTDTQFFGTENKYGYRTIWYEKLGGIELKTIFG